MRRLAAVVLLSLSLGACTHPAKVAPGSDPNVITRDEIEQSHGVTVYEVISRVRARFLSSRGNNSILADPQTYATVFINDQPYGDLRTLNSLMAEHFEEIHYYSGPDAVAKFGSKYGGGVIQLISRVE